MSKHPAAHPSEPQLPQHNFDSGEEPPAASEFEPPPDHPLANFVPELDGIDQGTDQDRAEESDQGTLAGRTPPPASEPIQWNFSQQGD